MESLLLDMGMAVWLGILTSISPCPLATNIAAISFVGRRAGRPRYVLLSGLLYALGRMAVYLATGLIVVKSLYSIPRLSNFLQNEMGLLVGPALIITSILMLDIIPFRFGTSGLAARLQSRVETLGLWGAFVLGALFALAFCPVSAGLFFGGLMALAVKDHSPFLMPLLYGGGTALPVIGFALLLTLSVKTVGTVFNKVRGFETGLRKATGIVFLLAGVYLIITTNLGIYLGF